MAETDGLRTLHEIIEELPKLTRDLNGFHGRLKTVSDQLLSAEHRAEDQGLSHELREFFVQLETAASHLVSAQHELLSLGNRVLELLKREKGSPGFEQER